MPTVQRYGQRKVDLEALPGVRKTAAETPESMGAGVAQAKVSAALSGGRGAAQKAEALAGVGGQVAQIGLAEASRLAAEARAQADQVSMMAAKNALARFETDRIYGEKGALTLKGKDALGLPEQIDTDFTAKASEIERGLNPRQLAMFQDIKGQARENIHATVQRHVFGEMQTYAKNEWEARVETSTNLIAANATDFRRVVIELKDVEADTIKAAPTLGLGPAALAATLDKIRGAAHSQVIEKLLTAGSTTAGKLDAALYYEEAKGQITDPKQRDKIESALNVGNVRKDGQTAADKILAEGGTLAEQRKKAAALENPQVRDDATARLEHEHAVRKAEEGQAQEDLLDNVYTRIEQGHGYDSITPDEQRQLGRHLPALRAEALRIAKGEPKETDPEVYYGLLDRAEEDPAGFASLGHSLRLYKLDDHDRAVLDGMQRDIRAGKGAPKALLGHSTARQIVADALSQRGLDPSPKEGSPQAKANAQLRRMVDVKIAAVEAGGKEVSGAEIQQAVDDILKPGPEVKGSWWGLVPGPTTPFFNKPGRRLIDLTIADIPAADRKRLAAKLKADGEADDDQAILNAYVDIRSRTQ